LSGGVQAAHARVAHICGWARAKTATGAVCALRGSLRCMYFSSVCWQYVFLRRRHSVGTFRLPRLPQRVLLRSANGLAPLYCQKVAQRTPAENCHRPLPEAAC
jgi:hypothetical protein